MATIEIDGKKYEVENGKMIIEVADDVGVHIPRFCYHKKLSVAANCRMCLVQVEKSRKPLPACATPITDGMKVYTKSEETLRSQQAVMEFLLINHPLDCPICDQGGECELQDVSLGFGAGESEYREAKRSVADEDLGSLISTEMTRCIQCTRCVRFGEEVAGVRELGATGRGEMMEISTYVEHAMQSEISGNIIDLCPVGALTSKPYRFKARAWEMTQYPSIAPHDCLGSNVHVHVRRNEVMRVVPKENEALNEVWLSDRDRFSYLGLEHPLRAKAPHIKREGRWEAVDWETALHFAAEGVQRAIAHAGPEKFAAFASPSSTLEEFYLLQKWMRSLKVNNLDYRLQAMDTRATVPVLSTLTEAEAVETQDYILIVGSHLHREVPLLATRVRKAFLAGARIDTLNPVAYDFPFEVTESAIVSPDEMVMQLAAILSLVVDDKKALPESVQKWILGVKPNAYAKSVAKALQAEHALIVTGHISENHPQAAILKAMVYAITQCTEAQRLCLTVGANALGAEIAGMVPYHSADTGLSAKAALEQKLNAYFLLNVEPEYDFTHPFMARQTLLGAEFVVALSAYDEPSIREYANVILPIGLFAETPGTYINTFQHWQTTQACVTPVGEARPAWKILRVLANLTHCQGFDYMHAGEVLEEVKAQGKVFSPETSEPLIAADFVPLTSSLVRVGEWPIYGGDTLVRHAEALQRSGAADTLCVRMHPDTIKKHHLGETVTVAQADMTVTLPLLADPRIAKGVVWLLNAMPETQDLGDAFGEIEVR